jgi:hypothetical protein
VAKQVWPTIIFKLGPLVVIRNWLDPMGSIHIDYNTLPQRSTYFSTIAVCRKLFGGVYWMREFRAEVSKEGLHNRAEGKVLTERR